MYFCWGPWCRTTEPNTRPFVVAQHAGRRAAKCAQAAAESFLCNARPAGALDRVAENLAGAAIDVGHEDESAILAAVDQSEVGGPTVVGMVGNYPRADFCGRTVLPERN